MIQVDITVTHTRFITLDDANLFAEIAMPNDMNQFALKLAAYYALDLPPKDTTYDTSIHLDNITNMIRIEYAYKVPTFRQTYVQ